MSVKVAIVEDNAGVRENWAKLINAEPGFDVRRRLRDRRGRPQALPGCRPDVVLMDINLPGMSGIECTARLKEKMPETQILMVTVYADNEHVFEALKMGASGYLLKCTEPSELTRSIAEVMRGGAPMTGQIARQVIAAFRRPAVYVVAEARLTPREKKSWTALPRVLATKKSLPGWAPASKPCAPT